MRKIIFFLILGLCCSACTQRGSYYHKYQHLPSGTWNREDTLIFQDTFMIFSQGDELELSAGMRHSDFYPYQKLSISIETFFQDSCYHDSITFFLCNKKGQWANKGWGSLYSVQQNIRTFSMADGESPFLIKINYDMRDSSLKGIHDIGINFSSSGRRLNAKK